MKLEHIPEDMTVTVSADVWLPEMQRELAKRGQWLPVDPPGTPTIRTLLDTNTSGPRRFAFGTIREHLLGLRVRLVDGREIKAGGKVVKNVAGYDLCKLFVGANGTLGEILEATFKLRPLPEVESFVQKRCGSLDEAEALINSVLDSLVTPVVLDLVPPATVVVGVAGTREEVDWQSSQLAAKEPTTLAYNRDFPNRMSVLPSKLTATLRDLKAKEFVARAGNGVIYFDGPPVADVVPVPSLQRRVKEAFCG